MSNMQASYTIVAPTKELFNKTIDFYCRLGFKLVAVADYPEAAVNSQSTPIWMKLFESTPGIESSSDMPCICIVMNDDNQVKDTQRITTNAFSFSMNNVQVRHWIFF